MVEASTQTDDDAGVGSSSTGTPSPLTTLVNSPTEQSPHVGAEDSELQDAVIVLEGQDGEEQMQEPSPSDEETTLEWGRSREDLDQTQGDENEVRVFLGAQAHPEDEETGDTQIAEAAGALQELAAASSTPMVQESLLDTEKAAHEQTRAELTQLKAEITQKDVELQRSGRRLRDSTASCDQLRGRNTYLRTQLDEANELISANDDLQTHLDDAYDQILHLETANGQQSDQITALQQEVGYMNDDAAWMRDTIRTGGKELIFFAGLGAKLYARLNRAGELVDGALGRSNRLMRSAAQRLSVYGAVDLYFRDAVVEEEKELTVHLAIEGARADVFAMDDAETGLGYEVLSDDDDLRQLVDEIFEAQHGTAVADGGVTGTEAEEEIQDTEPVLFSIARDQTSASPQDTLQADDAQTFNFGASAPIFGAQGSPDPVPKGDKESGSFNFRTATDFNFGATTSFGVGSGSFKAGSKDFGVTDQEEPKEVPTTKTRTASMFGAAAGVDLSPSSSENEGKANEKKKPSSVFEGVAFVDTSSLSSEKKPETTKKTKAASIFDAAAGINFSSPSSGSKDEANEKTKTASIFDAASFVNLTSPPSNGKTTLDASSDHDPKHASGTPKFAFTGSFDFAAPAANSEQEKEPAPIFGAGKSNQFSFSSSSAPTFGGFNGGSVGASNTPSDRVPVLFGGKGKQKEEPKEEAANAPIFSAEEMAKYDSPASGKKAGFDWFDFGIAGAFKGQPDASSRSLIFGQPAAETKQDSGEDLVRDLEGDHDSLYEYEDGYEPPTKKPTTAEQAEMEPGSATSSTDANEGDTTSFRTNQGFLGRLPVQLSDLRDGSQPVQSASTTATAISNSSTFGINVADRDQGSIEVDGGNAVDDVSPGALRVSSMPASMREGSVEVGTSDVVRGFELDTAAVSRFPSVPPAAQENVGEEEVVESLASQEANVGSQIEANEVEGNFCPGRTRTAEEILASWKAESGAIPTPWREPEWPASLPPLRASEPERSAELRIVVTPPTTATSTHPHAASTQAAASEAGAGAEHGIEEEINNVMGAIEALSLGRSAPRAKMSDLNTGIPFLSGDWFARRCALRPPIQRQVDAMEKEVGSEVGSRTRMEESRVTETFSGEERQAEQEITKEVEETPQADATNEEVPIRTSQPHSTTQPQRENTQSAVLRPHIQQPKDTSSALPTTTSTNHLQSHSQQTESQVASTATGQESWGRSKHGTPKDKKGGLRLWSIKGR